MKPPLEFLICGSTPKRFYLQWKAFDLLYRMRYILWVVALLGAYDVTKNGRHLGRRLGFYQGLEIISHHHHFYLYTVKTIRLNIQIQYPKNVYKL